MSPDEILPNTEILHFFVDVRLYTSDICEDAVIIQIFRQLFQIGCIGLMKAIDRFDQTFGVCFSTYAVPMIIGEIRRFLRDDGMIKVSRTVKETAVRARQLQAKYEAAYGIEPTVCQLASLMQIAPEELASALSSSQEVESLQKTIYQSDGNAILLEDRL